MTTLSYFFSCCEEAPWPRQLTKKGGCLIGGLQFQWVISSFLRSWQRVWLRHTGKHGARRVAESWHLIHSIRRVEKRGERANWEWCRLLKPHNPPRSDHCLPRPHLILPKQFHQLGIQIYEPLGASLIHTTTMMWETQPSVAGATSGLVVLACIRK